MTRDDWKTVIERAATLDERLAARSAGAAPASGRGRVATEILESWCRWVAGGSAETFARRLSWDGWTTERIRRALEATVCEAGSELPPWTVVDDEALAAAAGVRRDLDASSGLPELGAFEGEEGTPLFAEALVPFVRAARDRIRVACPAWSRVFTPEARRSLEAGLLAELGVLAELPLYRAFDERPRVEGAYRAFVCDLLAGGWREMWRSGPVLARLLGTVALDFVRDVSALARRLEEDASRLAAERGARLPVTAVRGGLGDRHAGSGGVRRLVFASGVELFHKPRALDADALWDGVLDVLATAAPSSAPPRLPLLAAAGGGFTGVARPESLANREEAERYFRRAGGLLAVAWLLGARDLHMENVVATREGPVAVDLEAILSPEPAAESEDLSAMGRAASRVGGSIAGSGLLSALAVDASGVRHDVGGLTGRGGHAASATSRAFRRPNRDDMALSELAVPNRESENLPVLAGRRLVPSDFPEATEEGFVEAFRALVRLRDSLAAPDGPLAHAASVETRVVLRPTDVYARHLALLAGPEHLGDGARRSAALDALNRPFARSPERPALWPFAADERAALERLDVPSFRVPAGSRALRSAGGEVVDGVLARSGLEALRARLDALTDETLVRERALLRSFLSPALSHLSAAAASGPALEPGIPEPAADDLVRRATAIGDAVLDAAVRGADGSIVWLSPETLRGDGRAGGGGAYHLYDGGAGVATFLAALWRATGEARFASGARGALAPLGRALDAPEAARLFRDEPLGGTSGLGSLFWASAHLARQLEDPGLLDLGRRLLPLVRAERIAADDALDLESGAAGLVLGLLAFRDAAGDSAGRALALAVAAGERLLARAHEEAAGGLSWTTADGLAHAGLAHGASGIALALDRLGRRAGDARFTEAARRARVFERDRFDRSAGTWRALGRDAQGAPTSAVMHAWCHGAPGLLLDRLSAPREDRVAAEDRDAALEAARRAPLLAQDHLCCGNAGVAEVLLEASRRLARPDLAAEARLRAAAVLRRADERGGFRFRASGPEAFEPGLFRGVSGVGLLLLRLAGRAGAPTLLDLPSAGE